jgi:streptogramin lyase
MVAPRTLLDVTRVSAGSANQIVKWTSSDDQGGSGFRHVTIYVATDGGDYKIWKRRLEDPTGSLVFEGNAGSTYQFIALATDYAGNRELAGPGVTAEADGSGVNLGGIPTVPETTPPNFGIPPKPAETTASNPLFLAAEKLIPATISSIAPPDFDLVLRPFISRSFATGIEQSHGDIGPMAIVETPEGDILISGGTTRGSLYRFSFRGGEAINAWAEVPYPVFNMAFDAQGRLWATTGGGPLLQLDPDNGKVLAEYGDGVTMAMAIDPATGLIYVATGAVWSGGVNGQHGSPGGVQVFDPEAKTFTTFNRDLNLRVASLAFAPDGSLWGTTWPDREQVVKFTPQRRAETMLRFEAPVDSIAFGKAGTDLAGLLFVTHNRGANDHPGSELTMVDVATLRRVTVADGGSRGDVIITTSQGRVLISQSNQVDVLNPASRGDRRSAGFQHPGQVRSVDVGRCGDRAEFRYEFR